MLAHFLYRAQKTSYTTGTLYAMWAKIDKIVKNNLIKNITLDILKNRSYYD